MEAKTTTEYRAHLTLNNGTTVSITGFELQSVEADIHSLIYSQRSLTPAQQNKPVAFDQVENGSLIRHESYLNGTVPLGWIVEYAVPEHMSVKLITEQRKRGQVAA